MGRPVLLLVVLAAIGLALAAWLLARGADERGGPAAAGAQEPQGGAPKISPFERSSSGTRQVEPDATTPEPSPAEPAETVAPPSTRWRVTILAEDRRPVPGATLLVLRSPTFRPVESVTAGDQGEVELVDPRAGDEWSAVADGFAETRLVLDQAPWPDEVMLVPGTVLLRGEVVDEAGEPVAGAQVRMALPARVWRAVTDDAGAFALRSGAAVALPGEAAFEIDAEGFCYLAQGVPVPIEGIEHEGSRIQLRVLRWARLAAEVVDEGGQPMPRATLRLLGPPEAEDRRGIPGGGDAAVRGGTGPLRSPDGRYLLEHVPPLLDVWLRVEHPHLEAVELALEPFAPGEVRERTVSLAGRLPRSGVLSFRAVAGDTGLPVPQAHASVGFERPGERSTSWITADGDGGFQVEPPPGDWELQLQAAGFAPLRRRFEVGFASEETTVLPLERSDLALEVVLSATGGGPPAGVLVQAIEVRDGGQHLAARSDESGIARFSGLDPAALYDVQVGFGSPGDYDPGGDRTHVPSPAAHLGVAGGVPLAFRLVAPASIEGRFLRTDLAGARARLSCVVPSARRDRPLFTVSAPLVEGRFVFHGLPPGRYHLWCEAAGSAGPFDPLLELDLGEGQRLGGLEIR